MNLTIVIPFWNGERYIDRLIKSIPSELPIIVVDDHSDAPYQSNIPNVTVLKAKEKGYFTGAVNHGISSCDTDVLVLNQDVWFQDTRWLSLINQFRRKYAMIGEGILGNHPAWPLGYIHGTFMFMRRDAIKATGLMNRAYYPLWGSTCEWQLRMCRQGFKPLVLPNIPGFVHREKKQRYGDAITEMASRKPKYQHIFFRTPPEISVVIPMYNYGRFLNDAVNSLIGGQTSLGHTNGQTFQSFEVIIVDDGSNDGHSSEIAKGLADPYKGIRYIRQENGGTAAAINTGVFNANGRFITVLSADDMMESWRLEELLKKALQNPDSYVYDDPTTFTNGRLIERMDLGTYNYESLIHKNHVHAGIFFQKKAWDEVGGYPELMANGREDWAFNVALGWHGWHGVKIDNSGYLYRRENHNRTLTNTTPQHRNNFYQDIRNLYPEVYGEKNLMGGCCGSANKKMTTARAKANATKKTLSMPGADGMVLIEYIGSNKANMSWYAPSGITYYIGGVTRRVYVDKDDVDFFLKCTDNGERSGPLAFQQVNIEMEPKQLNAVEENPVVAKDVNNDIKAASQVTAVDQEPDDEPVITAVVPDALEVVEAEVVEETAVVDPKGYSVSKFRKMFNADDYTADQLHQMLALEQENEKPRSTIIGLIESALEA